MPARLDLQRAPSRPHSRSNSRAYQRGYGTLPHLPWGEAGTIEAPPIPLATVTAASNNGAQLDPVPTPSGATVNSMWFVALADQNGSATGDYTNNAGMVRRGPPFVNATSLTRVAGLWGLPVTNPLSLPSSVTFTRPASTGRIVAVSFITSGVDPVQPVDVFTPTLYTGGLATQGTAPALTATVPNTLAVAVIAASWSGGVDSTITSVTPGWTLLAERWEPNPPSTGVSRNSIHVYTKPMPAAGSTGDLVVTFAGAPAQRTGQMVILRPPTAAPFWTVPAWRAASTFAAVAHRGAPNGTALGEFSFAAYDAAIARGFTCLEASVHPTSDGAWVLNHNATTGAQYTADLTIATSTLAQLRALTRKYGPSEPMMTLDEFFARYGRFARLIENKAYASFTAFFDKLDANDPQRNRTVFKATGDSATEFGLAKARGYTTWGYYFGTAGASTMPTVVDANQDWVGLSSGPNNQATAQTWFDWAATNSKPVIGHVVYDAADWTSMKAQGAAMGMVNNPTTFPLA